MSHDHSHHSHLAEPKALNTAFIIGIAFNFLFVVIEVIAGLFIHSLSLLSDAGHNLADVVSLALSLLAFRLLSVKPTENYTYGYRKTSILVALFNAVVLLLSIGAICYEAIHRLLNPEPLPGFTIAVVAGIGIIINSVTALLFFREKEKDLNVKSAYLHLFSDALVSLGLVMGGIIIYYTQWFWIDSVLSILIALVILFGTWNLLSKSLRLSLDGVPESIDLKAIREKILAMPGVKDIHHIHVWAISTTENALTAHVVIDEASSLMEADRIKKELRHLLEHENIQHVTIETEAQDVNCETEVC